MLQRTCGTLVMGAAALGRAGKTWKKKSETHSAALGRYLSHCRFFVPLSLSPFFSSARKPHKHTHTHTHAHTHTPNARALSFLLSLLDKESGAFEPLAALPLSLPPPPSSLSPFPAFQLPVAAMLRCVALGNAADALAATVDLRGASHEAHAGEDVLPHGGACVLEDAGPASLHTAHVTWSWCVCAGRRRRSGREREGGERERERERERDDSEPTLSFSLSLSLSLSLYIYIYIYHICI